MKQSRLRLPSEGDYRTRLDKLQVRLRAAGIDVAALTSFDNHRFFGGVDGIATVRQVWLVVQPEGAPAFVSPRIEAPEIAEQSWIPIAQEWVEWSEADLPTSSVDALVATLPPNASVIGVDFDATSAATVEALRERVPSASIVDITEVVRSARQVKDEPTIGIVRACGDIAAHQFEASRAAAEPGTPEWQIALASRTAGMERAAEWWGGDPDHSPLIQGIHVMASGPHRTPRPHAVAAGRDLADGDLLQLCYCGRPLFGHGICFDRPLHIGTTAWGPDVQLVVDTARAAQEAALETVQPGVTVGAIHAVAAGVIESSGLPAKFMHRTGRGIGLSDPEWPEIREGGTTALEPGMLLGIEPGVYVPGVAGARFGDTILVTETGFDPLTPLEVGRAA